MVRLVRMGAVAVLSLLLMVGIAAWSAYTATQRVRPFYVQAIEQELEADALERVSRELETQAGALYSDAQHGGTWRAVFTEQQLNAWLALELERNYADVLPPTVSDPRVAIDPPLVRIGFRSQKVGIETVISIDSEMFLAEANVVAIRLRSVRAGALPLPVAQVADEVRLAVEHLAWPVRWSQVDGDVVALVELFPRDDDQITVETLEVHEGELYVAGRSHSCPVSEVPLWNSGLKGLGELGLDGSLVEFVDRGSTQSGTQSSRQ